jgi:NAD(P)-dependent dehydrogenase (short-subunit alcohol dehydrogenase family)
MGHRAARGSADPTLTRRYDRWQSYFQSKLANLLFTAELQRRLAAAGSPVIATAAHPGWASTGFEIASGNRLFDVVSAVVTPVLAQGPERAALPTLLAAVGDVAGGSFTGPSRLGGMRGPATTVESSAGAKDAAVAGRLWEVSEQLTGCRFPLTAGPVTS